MRGLDASSGWSWMQSLDEKLSVNKIAPKFKKGASGVILILCIEEHKFKHSLQPLKHAKQRCN